MSELYAFDEAVPVTADRLAAIKAHGGIAVARYLPGPAPVYAWKRASPAEVKLIRSGGVSFLPTYEHSSSDAEVGGRSGGRIAGQIALDEAARCGIPTDNTIGWYFSDDTYTATNELDEVEQFWLGINDVVKGKLLPKAYAEGLVIDYLVGKRLVVGKQWLAAPKSWPGYNPRDSDVAMVQLVGDGKGGPSPVSSTDLNLITDPYGLDAFWPDESPYGGNDMPLTEADFQRISKIVHDQNVAVNLRSDEAKQMVRAQTGAAISPLAAVVAANQAELLGALKGADGTVDVAELAAKLADALGPELANQFLEALKDRLAA